MHHKYNNFCPLIADISFFVNKYLQPIKTWVQFGYIDKDKFDETSSVSSHTATLRIKSLNCAGTKKQNISGHGDSFRYYESIRGSSNLKNIGQKARYCDSKC